MAFMVSVGLSFGVIWTIYSLSASASPKTHISEGVVSGVYMESHGGRPISAFLGIPYAEPPIGDLRFKSPMEKKPWNGIYKAHKDGSKCPQLEEYVLRGNEDCLYLNVFTPLFDDNIHYQNHTLLPVMFWIHGGGFGIKSSDSKIHNPRYLLDKDVILVDINYRLGVLGYLSTGDSASPGNYGLKDMVLALKWVQKNIEAFGGDPKKVTIFGQGAGGAAVELLMLSDATNGLFQRSISQSGSALSSWAFRKQPEYATRLKIFGSCFGCLQNDNDKLVACLRNLTTSQLLNKYCSVFDNKQLYKWGPTSEENSPDAVLTDSPENILERGGMKELDWMTGSVRDEGLKFTLEFHKNDDWYDSIMQDIDKSLEILLQYDFDSLEIAQVVEKVKKSYFNNTFTEKNAVLKQMTKFLSDLMFLCPMTKMLEKTIDVSQHNSIYFYNFNFCGAFSNFTKVTDNSVDCGIPHFMDVLYLFESNKYGDVESTMRENDKKVVSIMVDLWTSFAINGKPVTTAVNNGKIWEPYNRRGNLLSIGNQFEPSLSLKTSFYKERTEFCKTLYRKNY